MTNKTPEQWTAEAPLPMNVSKSLWKHRNGNLYQTLFFANVPKPNEPNKAGYVETVVYRNMATGAYYTRPADDWHRSMTPAEFSERQLRLQDLIDSWTAFSRQTNLVSIRTKSDYLKVSALHKEVTCIVKAAPEHPLREMLHLIDDIIFAYNASDAALE